MVLHCIRFGEIVMDENFRTFLLCNKCHTEFLEVPEFRVHLATSACGEPYFRKGVVTLKFGAATAKRRNGQKQYLIYNPAEVQTTTSSATQPTSKTPKPTTGPATKTSTSLRDTICTTDHEDAYIDLLKIEEELLDPRWYTDIQTTETTPNEAINKNTNTKAVNSPITVPSNKQLEYKELVEAVGPYVQFKENVRKPTNVALNPAAIATNKSQEAQTNKVKLKKIETASSGQLKTVPNSTAIQLGARILNPTAKRKYSQLQTTPPPLALRSSTSEAKLLPMAPKGLNEKKLLKPTDSQKSSSQQSQITKPLPTIFNSPPPKRRKMLTIPMTQVHIHPEFQEQFGGKYRQTTTELANKTQLRSATTQMQQQPKREDPVKPKLVPNTAPMVAVKQTRNIKTGTIVTTQQQKTNDKSSSYKNIAPELKKAAAAAIATKNKPIISTPVTASIAAPATATAKTITTTTTTTTTLNATSSQQQARAPPARVQQTAAILNKLQTLGLQVKRTQPPNSDAAATLTLSSNNQTLELLKKLQSKGMKVKLVNGKQQQQQQSQTQTIAVEMGKSKTTNSNSSASSSSNTNTLPNKVPVSTRKTHLNGAVIAPAAGKTILNSKLIIKKVK